MNRADLARGAGRAAVLASLLTAACGTIQPQVAYPNVERGAQAQPSAAPQAPAEAAAPERWDNTLAGLREADQRVADVAYRIVTASAALCSDVRAQSGLVLQTALQYSPRLRPQVEAAFHIDDRAAVEAVAAGSPAALAGLQRDDILLAVNGQPLETGVAPASDARDERPASYAPVQNALSAIATAMARGAAQIRVERGSRTLDAMLVPKPGCDYDAQVLPGPELNASADGRHVFISTGLVSYASSDDVLAVFLGHEFAHDVLHHHERLDEKGFARDVLGEFGSTPASHMVAEKEADYVGLYLTARAGYDISQAPDIWRRMPPVVGDFGFSHPSNGERAAALAATRDEILAKRQRGEPLVPTPSAEAPEP